MKDSGFSLRLEMVMSARQHGISEAARRIKASRRCVRKWVNRYGQGGLEALRDQSRAPRHRPLKISQSLEQKIRDLRQQYRWGPQRLKSQCGLPCSPGAIYRVIRQAGLIGKRVKKYKRRRDLRQAKKKLAPFEKIQFDTKELRDIPEYWELGRARGLPGYEYTARDVRTGTTFIAFAQANDGTHAAAFATYLLSHLSHYGVEVSESAAQSDNGSEYIGCVTKKSQEPSEFEAVLKSYRIRHARIPPRCSTWQSDVESVHRTIEEELYAIEPLRDLPELLGKAYAYQLFYNHFRKIRTRDNCSPRQILEQVAPGRYDPNILSLPPVLLDALLASPKGGTHVPESTSQTAASSGDLPARVV